MERAAMESAPLRFVSAVSLWESAILLALQKIRAPSPEAEAELLSVPVTFELLGITPAHCRSYRALPQRHREPFDRMLVAQARVEALTLMARDSGIRGYAGDGVSLL